MKTKILLLAIAIMGSSLFAFSQQVVPHEIKTDCDQKVLKKIKRNMNRIYVKDYLDVGEKSSVVITCTLNEDQNVEVANITGVNEELKSAIIETLKNNPIQCDYEDTGKYFTFKMTFYHHPA